MGDDGGVLAKAKCCGGLGGATKRSCRVAGLVTGRCSKTTTTGTPVELRQAEPAGNG